MRGSPGCRGEVVRGPVGRWGQWQGPHPSVLLPQSADEASQGGGRGEGGRQTRKTEVTGAAWPWLRPAHPRPSSRPGLSLKWPLVGAGQPRPLWRCAGPSGPQERSPHLLGSGPHCDASGGVRQKLGVREPASVALVKAASWSWVLPCPLCTPPQGPGPELPVPPLLLLLPAKAEPGARTWLALGGGCASRKRRCQHRLAAETAPQVPTGTGWGQVAEGRGPGNVGLPDHHAW